MSHLLPLEERLAAEWPVADWRDVTLLIAVSGGPDSVALLRALARLRPPAARGPIVVGHFNHRLRGSAAEADERFVVDLCQALSVECVVGQASAEVAATTGDGIEAAARAARYQFLGETAKRLGARFVATGHTADDQAETILHHIVRGTGLRGLAGMRRARQLNDAVTLIRPMLNIHRAELMSYLEALQQPTRLDESNLEPCFTRNRIRNELLPLLAKDYSPAIGEALTRLGALARDAQRLIDQLATALLARAEVDGNEHQSTLDCRLLANEDRHLVREMFVVLWRERGWPLQAMGQTQWNALADMALKTSDAPRQILPGAVSVLRAGDLLNVEGPTTGNRALNH